MASFNIICHFSDKEESYVEITDQTGVTKRASYMEYILSPATQIMNQISALDHQRQRLSESLGEELEKFFSGLL